ncbi:MAG: RsmE family RNA methyltransferase [Cyanobacteriota bacterium]
MGRERRRLLIAQERLLAATAADSGLPRLVLTNEESHYVSRVLRLRQDQELAIINGRGQLWGARVAEAAGRRIHVDLLQPIQTPECDQPGPSLTISLAIALPRRDSDLLLRMACELGVDRLQPLIADHSVLAERFQRQRLEAILREATEQCERLWLPSLADPCPGSVWLERSDQGLRLLATTRRGHLPGPIEQLRKDQGRSGDLVLAIGPEGGWSEREEERAEASGWQPVSLTTTILRTSTAAVAGIALLSHWRDLLQGSEAIR